MTILRITLCAVALIVLASGPVDAQPDYEFQVHPIDNCIFLNASPATFIPIVAGTHPVIATGSAEYAMGKSFENVMFRHGDGINDAHAYSYRNGSSLVDEITTYGNTQFWGFLCEWNSVADNTGSVTFAVGTETLVVDGQANCIEVASSPAIQTSVSPGVYSVGFSGNAEFDGNNTNFDHILIHYTSTSGEVTDVVHKGLSHEITVVSGDPNLSIFFVDWGSLGDNGGMGVVTLDLAPSVEPIGYWSFDDGTATDDSPYGHDGVIHGEPSQINGVCGQALFFDGVDDYVDLGNPPALNPTDEITLAAWYKPVSFDGLGNNPIIDKGFTSHSSPYYQYHLGVSGNLGGNASRFSVDIAADGNWTYAVTPPEFWTPGQWYHIVGTFDGTETKLFVNGELIASSLASGAMTDYGSSIYIGRFTNMSGDAYLPGAMDEIRIYNRALDPSEIGQLYSQCNVVSVPLDIKPKKCPNVIKIEEDEDEEDDGYADYGYDGAAAKEKHDDDDDDDKRIKVAVVGTADFDVNSINVASVLLEGVEPSQRWKIKDKSTPVDDIAACACSDEGKDGIDDLVLKFRQSELLEAIGPINDGDEIGLTLTGELNDGTPFEGSDCVVIRIEGDDDDDDDGDGSKSGSSENNSLPTEFALNQNHPNPFNPSTTISFSLPEAADVRIDIYNVAGQKVATLIDGLLEAGRHRAVWDATDVASGVYLYRLTAGEAVETRKMMLLK